MRNLKKLFAVVMVVAMLASIMVPALAAESYEAEAKMLRDLGLFQGYGDGSLGLGDDLTREQALALMLRVMGLEDDVKAMSDEEVAEQMARVVDPETVTETWARPYVAYAVKNGLTKGIDASILPNVKFAGQLKVTGKEFINFILNGMGYEADWDDVLNMAARVEMLEPGDVLKFAEITAMKRDDAVGVMASALTGITAAGVTLAEALVEAGAVDEDKMIEYGFIEPKVVPTEVPVEFEATASTDNLAQIYVEFNREVDKDSAEDTANYEIKDIDIADAALQDDGVTVVLTLDFEDVEKKIDQQYVADLVISGVKDLNGNVLKDYTIEDIEFFDTTIPTVVDAAVVGNDTIKVTFSEPVKGNLDEKTGVYKLDKSDFSVNNGKTYVKQVKLQKNNTEALVELYNNLKEGEVTLTVKAGTKDFAGFGVVVKTYTLEVVADEEAPVVIGYEKASRYEVTLIWNEDIESNKSKVDPEDWYHTNSKNTVREENKEKDELSVKFDGNKTTLYFDEDSLLPNGTAYVYVMSKAVRDLWDNENDQQMIKVEVEVDETPPEVDKIDVKAENKIEIKFTEELDEDSAEDEDNYTLLDKDGKEVKDIFDDIDYSSKKVTILFEEDLSGDYTIVLQNIKDKAGNKMSKTAVDFNVGDKTAPNKDDFKATLYRAGAEDQMIRIDFNDKMATDGKYAVTDVEKYVIVDGSTRINLEKIEDVEIVVVDDGEAVEIYVPSYEDIKKDVKKPESGKHYYDFTLNTDDDDNVIGVNQKIEIARVADAAGNKVDFMTHQITLNVSESIKITKAEATARDTIEITFDDELVDFEADDIIIEINGEAIDAKNDIAGVTTKLNKDGNTVAVFTLDSDMIPASFEEGDVVVEVVEKPESENRYEKKLEAGQSKSVADKIKPQLYEDKDDKVNIAERLYYSNAEIKDGLSKNRYVDDYFALNKKDKPTVVDDVYYFEASLLFNEPIKVKDGVSSALAGSDFIVKLGKDTLHNGTDYIVEIDEVTIGEDETNVYRVVFLFNAKKVEEGKVLKGYELKGDLEISLVEKPNYIVDMEDNVLDKFDKIKVKNIDFSTVEK